MDVSETHSYLENCLLLRLVSGRFWLGIPLSLAVLGKIVPSLCQAQCAWVASMTGPEIEKERYGLRGSRPVRKAGLRSSPLPAGGPYIQPLFTCDSAAAVLKMNKLCGNDISIFVFLLQTHRR